jgi:hypothetical protein
MCKPSINILFYKSGVNRNKRFQHFFFFIDNNPRYQKMVKIKDTQFCMENLNLKRKKDKKFFDLPELG